MSEKLKADGYEPAIDEHGKIVNGVPYIALSTAQALADALEACKVERDALCKELESALSLMREHGIGLNAGTLDDAIRQALQAVIVDRGNCVVLKSERDNMRTAIANHERTEEGYCEEITSLQQRAKKAERERDEWRDAAGRQTAQVVDLQTECDEARKRAEAAEQREVQLRNALMKVWAWYVDSEVPATAEDVLGDDWQRLKNAEDYEMGNIWREIISKALADVPAEPVAEPPVSELRKYLKENAAIVAKWPDWMKKGARPAAEPQPEAAATPHVEDCFCEQCDPAGCALKPAFATLDRVSREPKRATCPKCNKTAMFRWNPQATNYQDPGWQCQSCGHLFESGIGTAQDHADFSAIEASEAFVPAKLDPALREPMTGWPAWTTPSDNWVSTKDANAHIAKLLAEIDKRDASIRELRTTRERYHALMDEHAATELEVIALKRRIDGEPERTKEAIDRRINSMFGPVGSGSNEAESRDRLRLRGFAQVERRLAELENQVAGEPERQRQAVAAEADAWRAMLADPAKARLASCHRGREVTLAVNAAVAAKLQELIEYFLESGFTPIAETIRKHVDELLTIADELDPPLQQGGTEEKR